MKRLTKIKYYKCPFCNKKIFKRIVKGYTEIWEIDNIGGFDRHTCMWDKK